MLLVSIHEFVASSLLEISMHGERDLLSCHHCFHSEPDLVQTFGVGSSFVSLSDTVKRLTC